jgi:hypothetical protein
MKGAANLAAPIFPYTLPGLFRFFVGQEAGYRCFTNRASPFGHFAASLRGFNASPLDGPFFAAFYTITFKVHWKSPFLVETCRDCIMNAIMSIY